MSKRTLVIRKVCKRIWHRFAGHDFDNINAGLRYTMDWPTGDGPVVVARVCTCGLERPIE